MRPSPRVCSALANHGRARAPLIHFTGRRWQWPSTPETPHAHPAAPQEFKDHFADFVKKYKASGQVSNMSTSTGPKSEGGSGSKSDNVQVFKEFWEAPKQYWTKDLEQWEIDLVETGGASQF